jgi:Copper type II ascorbate-dependent monooxygenase, C-terminal domain/Copper type II ascorbate-dependent monooxygenase, N-terminal domain
MYRLHSRTAWPLALILCALASSLGGCRDRDDDDDTAGDSGTTTAGADASSTGVIGEAPTFWQEVAPIYYDQCVGCHRDGGIAPFALDDYATAATWAQASAMAVADRTMPPWLATDDGTCGSFVGSRALAPESIDTIVAWADGGAPEGTVRTDLVLPEVDSLADAVELHTPAFAPIAEGTEYAETDEYRCFILEPAVAADTFMTGYEVVAGNDALVHHVLVFDVDPDLEVAPGQTNGERIAALDAESPDREGWPCFGAAGEGTGPNGVPVSWAPGQGVTHYPADTGYRIAQGSMLVAQIHYNLAGLNGAAPPVSTTVRASFTDSVQREGFFNLPDPFLDTLFEGTPAELAPGEEAVDYAWEIAVDDLLGGGPGDLTGFDLFGVLPHMHGYGRSLRFDVLHADGTQDCGLDVPRWDFDWQLYYFYETPVRLGPGDRVRVTCTYDTREATEPVLPGWGTGNEMCLLGVFMVPATE